MSAPSPDTAARLVEALRGRGWLAATAESCTGGGVAQAITSVAGSSEVFDRAFVTYSNEAKMRDLGVPASLLEAHGAVSEAVARAMAEGALRHAGVQVAIATSGIAGPDGGVPGKPVGTVWFARSVQHGTGLDTAASVRHFPGDREAVRRASVQHALQLILDIPDRGAS